MIWLGFGALVLLAAGLRITQLHLAADRALRSRKLDIEERQVTLAEQKAKGTQPPALIPPDLQRRITLWGDQLSQESERKIILDLYADVAPHYDTDQRRWQEVRSMLPALQSDDREVPVS